MAQNAGERPRWDSVADHGSSHADRDQHDTTVIDDTFRRPGTIKINVTGAFITAEGSTTPPVQDEGGGIHESKDIRLPHHTGIVSHVAIDVKLATSV